VEAGRDLELEGRLIATAEVPDPRHQDHDRWQSLYVFRTDDGFNLVTFGRRETYDQSGVERGPLDITVDHPSDLRDLHDFISGRAPAGSDAWWQILEAGRHHDDELHAAWVPERIRRDLDPVSLFAIDLVPFSGFFDGVSNGLEM
jgi:hypothetical protein